MKLNGKRVLLTGATGGIGKEIAAALAKQGCELIVVGRKASQLAELVANLDDSSRHQSLIADLARTEGLDAVSQFCASLDVAGKPVDIVINNAGCNTFLYLQDRDPASVKRDVELNLIAPILLSQSALGWMAQDGVILNVGSTFGAIGFPCYTSYCAAKAGLQRFSEALSRELNGTGRRVQYLAPRATNTSLNDARVTEMNEKLGNKTDEAAFVAAQAVDMLKQETSVKWIGWPEKLFVRLNQLFPSLVGSAIKKQHQTITEYATKTRCE
ncbi:short chain dehydrogenase [Enterovibrio norvegicus FF-33]|uniref:SDR family oxidoreductase n=1 Tax=Enterovibrio norvegicus TaxID=188144 RepID=UPI0002EC2D4D|nr:SDR family oxidoreductase [Enterovibrio norvegicus]OEE66760.1 short chain dehydrogenase [Enterovibrio norvegicus FF-33]